MTMAFPTAKRTRYKLQSRLRIAAIDFGTTYTSLAYVLPKDGLVVNMPINMKHATERVPTAILLKKESDGTLSVESFGSEAQKQVAMLNSSEVPEYLYFECFKMKLRGDELKITRDLPVEAFNGESYYLVEVIAFILCHLKKQLLAHLSKSARFSSTDFEWVITVPTIWNADAKQMMREAAYMGGLLSDNKEISRLTPVQSPIRCPEEANPEKLSLALESESAAMYCQGLPVSNDKLAFYSQCPQNSTECYMVLDIGGGTVDITVHTKDDSGNIKVKIPPTGNASGGRKINDQFYDLLAELVIEKDRQHAKKKGSGFSNFCAFLEQKGKEGFHKAVLSKIVYSDFEEQKQTFGNEKPGDGKSVRIMLHSKFLRTYEDTLIEAVSARTSKMTYNEETSTLILKPSQMEELFKPVVDGVISCVVQTIQNVIDKIDVIYTVGGFGGCRYTYEKLKDAIHSYSKYRSIPLVVPLHHTWAVSQGAVIYRSHPEKIIARVMDASYGIACGVSFKEGVHDEHYAFYHPDTKEKECGNVFLVYAKKRETVSAGDFFKDTLIPFRDRETSACFSFYRATDPSIRYTVDKHGKPTVEKLGSLKLDIPNPNKIPRSERKMEISMDFSSTEIKVQARALYLPDQPPVKAVLDFL